MKTLILASAFALALATPASAANLLTNGSFEDGGFGPWTVTALPLLNPGTLPVVIPYGSTAGYPGGAFGEAINPNTVLSASPDAVGRNVVYFSSDTANPQTLTQMLNLTAGTIYNVGFDYYAPLNGIQNPFDANLQFLVGGAPVGTILTAGSGAGTTAQTWFNFASSFTATSSGLQAVSFSYNGLGVTAADFAVDRVYVTAAVPEPGTWALMLIGFGAIGASLRRRRSARPVAQLA